MPPSPAIPKSNRARRNRNSTIIRLLNYTVFTLLSTILLCLILLTPADAIYQCYVTKRLTNIFIITGGYVVTFLLAVLIYATRIYTNRSVLGGIPKAWIPVEKEDVGKSVRRLVVEGLGRSALIAWGARPREVKARSHAQQTHALADPDAGGHDDEERKGLLRGFDFDVDPANPPWGVIEHPGWSAPESSLSASAPTITTGDAQPLPGLCYRTVVRELPHLIEAKAVSLAPPDPVFRLRSTNPAEEGAGDWAGSEEGQEIPDTRIVAILRRPPTMSLRSYIHHLTELSILNPPETGIEFLALYERARFSGRDLYEGEFRALMGVFADLLRGMRSPNHHLLDMHTQTDGHSMRDTHSLFGSRTESVIGPSDEEGETETDTLGSVNSPRSRAHTRYGPDQYTTPTRSGYLDGTETRTSAAAAARPESTKGRMGEIQSSSPSQLQARSQWPRTPSPSTRSLRPVRSNVSRAGSRSGASLSSASRSGSGGSVIRLADVRTESVSGLPYVIGRQDGT
ncbi:hypothetical protein ASPVEDRAFT_42260 [Aspergillus versicolor CBS 583.65]|uniref:Defect at low temperature protein 1 n=1 Tax=Aspergillus versicolor CBS 583.65 TaxID=1036611 RepID=A0A1L9PMM1_ASPVE|nr:uncharacterized protein ASPVEDRAFT_42260 [Aspergillus versicolor CBS 583.65]OJJ02751.1 hypothetical protein ASPVEDRAFT_42260 [Aspergillus versicolor CBS 583.65]